MIPISTVRLLRTWARWGECQHIGYPSISPMFGERALKASLFGIGHIPEGVMEMEQAVCRLAFEDRQIIIQRYQRHMNFNQIAYRMGYSRWKVSRRIREAESEVHRILEEIYCNFAHESIVSVAR